LARDQVARALASQPAVGFPSLVLCWDDLWRWVRLEAVEGPAWLSQTAARAVLNEAIDRAETQGLLEPLRRFVGLAGYRRQLHEQFQGWTRAERAPRAAGRGSNASRIESAERELFGLYRVLLEELDAEDEAGAGVWASKRLTGTARLWKRLDGPGPLVVFGMENPTPARWRFLGRAARADRSLHVPLVHDADPALSEVALATQPTRSRLLEMGLQETRLGPQVGRPAGLACAERVMFALPADDSSLIADTTGLLIEGAPEAEGTARVVCRAVRELRHQGVPAEEILILVRHWGTEAELIREGLQSWGIEVDAEVREPLRSEPAVSALLLAASIPLEDWETELIVRLLRNGQVSPDWPGEDRVSLATAASTIHSTHVVRGRDALLRGLDRMLTEVAPESLEYLRTQAARGAAERIVSLLAPLNEKRPWSAHVNELRRIAGELGIGRPGPELLEPFWEALDEQSDVLERLGKGETDWSWASAIAEVEAILNELPVRPAKAAPGSVRLTTVDLADGARAEHVILADLVEGSFPARSAVRSFLALRPGDTPEAAGRASFAREMARFLGVLGMARSSVRFVYPTTDAKGQELLRAGFLDDLLARLSAGAAGHCHSAIPRLHPALIDHPDLAGSPTELRVRAMALAGERGQLDDLAGLAGDPAHRPVLRGAAAALFAHQRRVRGTPFGEYDGLLKDGAARLELDSEFGSAYRFSPSQLETYLSCPFQFFSKYVLKLKVVEDRDELDEDATRRGSQLHDILESFETLVRESGDEQSPEQLAEIELNSLRNREPAGASELDLGRWEIERERLERTFGQYLVQRRAYQRSGVLPFLPVRLEFDFGGENEGFPVLELAQGGRRVLVRGRIDRIDVAETEAGTRFRVIDYKSGSAPGVSDVKQGVMVQLPLYAMAVQRLLFPEGQAGLFDLGYWSLRRDGFKSIAFASWEQDQVSLVEHVLAVVDRLRRGEFVVQSRNECCESYCEYRGVCRVRQVRRAGKQHDLGFASLSAQAQRRRSASGSGSKTDAGEAS
jgi:RecB family exonuclease